MDRNFPAQPTRIPKAFIICAKTFDKSPFKCVGKLFNYTIPGDMLGSNYLLKNKYEGDNVVNITLNRLTGNHLTVLGQVFDDVKERIEMEGEK